MRNELAVPAEILDVAEQLARRLGLSSSELFTVDISDFIQRHHQIDITAELDKIYSETNSALDPVLSAMQLRSLAKTRSSSAKELQLYQRVISSASKMVCG